MATRRATATIHDTGERFTTACDMEVTRIGGKVHVEIVERRGSLEGKRIKLVFDARDFDRVTRDDRECECAVPSECCNR